jgi:hypothetical protein
MATSPIKVKDSTHMIINPRQNLLEEGIDKIRGGKGMILKGFKTEKTRVEEHLRNINFDYTNFSKSKINNKSNKNYNISNNSINNNNNNNTNNNNDNYNVNLQQPVLRFKPRTDLERIFEEINKNSFRTIDKNIIEKQIKNIDKVIIKNPIEKSGGEIPDYNKAFKEEEEYDDFDYLGIKGIIDPKEEEIKKLEIEKKNKLLKSTKKNLNLNAKNLMKELHNKTHFKGVTSLVNYNSLGIFYLFF